MNAAEFNYIESGLWFLLALILTINALTKGKLNPYFKIKIISAIAFFAFGISDIIEAQTGAWWWPFSLFLLKAICVITFVICFFKYKKIERSIKSVIR